MPFAAPASNQTPLFQCCQSSHWGEESRPGGAGEQHHDARRPLLTARTSITTRPNWSRDQFFVSPRGRLDGQPTRLTWPLVGHLVGCVGISLSPVVAALGSVVISSA